MFYKYLNKHSTFNFLNNVNNFNLSGSLMDIEQTRSSVPFDVLKKKRGNFSFKLIRPQFLHTSGQIWTRMTAA